MKHSLDQIAQGLSQLQDKGRIDTRRLYRGIELSYLALKSDQLTLPHDALEHILEINYCRAGRMGWKMGNGNTVYLGPGDYSIHTMDVCADSVMTLPNGYYEGLALCIDLDALSQNPPELLAGTGITGAFLIQKFCKNSRHASFARTAQSESIFSGFYEQPEPLLLPYQKLKAMELLLYLGKRDVSANEHLADYQAEQIEIIRNIHEQLTQHMEEHFTIESLAKQYLMNPTTLKTVFKAVYGNSIAAHTKEHRMERAAKLLLETQDSISGIARAVGYENQSKFTAAFKEYYQILPTEYRKQHYA
ncbi:MAG: helix-turn-helix transcriptional regulator [Enterocloster asparagiformis]|nr:helix-turn-helix transcriptional regulator [Enterocloster asparagiformis]